jgi:CRP/FNR family cyclic AMP-dependent transcriptional regulator
MLVIPVPSNPAASGPGERLQDLPSALAADLLATGLQRSWRRGQPVMRQGTPCDSLVVALQGRLAVNLGSADGRDTLLRWLDAGELVGLPAVLAGMPATVTIVAQGPARTLHVPRADFIALLQRHPDGAIATAVLVSRRLGELFRYLERSQGSPLADRVDYALQRLAHSQGQADAAGQIRLKVTQAELADAARASRQRVHLVLQQLQAAGRIRLGYGWVTLLPGAGWAP